ncbi:MAG: molecular chaperone HtpG [Lentisphaeria bacterium]|jgi:molecular chaperone HtpG|nr:molecular chaperone HtpG [Lentisphaeria bacterium]NLZ59369.1 molecular chaperone HtpG [Lentisphaerota bacterium]
MSKKRAFKTEVQRLLDLVIHSLYSNKEIFLRELLSNASDAIDRARFESLKDESILEDDPDWKIKISVDADKKLLTISDNGIGMSADEVEKNIGTVANSGTRRFLEQLQENKEALAPELIGQFGVGFYSAFMVADKVTVLTRRAGQGALRWESSGDGYYTLEEAEREKRGSDIILHLNEEHVEYLEEWKIRKTVKKYSDFVEHPICMDIVREEVERDEEGKEIEGAERKVTVTEETLNSRKAIWLRPKNEVNSEDYAEFYKHISHDFQEPFESIHWNVEGQAEFKALVYIPQRAGMDMFMPEQKNKGLQLYVHRVFITDNCEELLPNYLRFLRGVVDSADLPLNVSREMLQEARALQIIRKNVVRKVLDTLAEIKEKQSERYEKFWESFGKVLKEGLHTDFENREKLQDLLLFESSSTEPGKLTSLADYVKRMPEEQKDIYYLTAEDRNAAQNAPQLEIFRSKGFEVLFMIDPIDEWIVNDISSFEEKKLTSISKGDVDLDSEDEKAAKEESRKKVAEENKGLLEKLSAILSEKVKEVRFSKRLTESACCLVSDEWGMGVQMEKILKAMQQEVPSSKRILELNPEHALVGVMRQLYEKQADHPKLDEYARLLYDQALLMAQLPIEDPLNFAKAVSALMAEEAGRLSE